MKKQIQIFKPGKHAAMSGDVLSFSEADLKASAAAYDPAKHEAPIVVGHPRHNAPAYGWVKSLQFADGLEAEPQQIDPAFAEMVDRGAFKKISASFYMPDSPSNPVPGVYYLRHVGFLGALPPAVKGLRAPEFGDAETGIVEFADWDDLTVAQLFRNLREWFIGRFGQDEADKVIPGYNIDSLQASALQEEDDDGLKGGAAIPASFSEKGSDQVTPEEKAKLEADNARLQAENEAFKKREADFAEAQAKAKRETVHAENVAFCEGLVKAGKLLPANKQSAVALMDTLASQESVIEFGEGEAKKSLTPLAAYKEQLESSPVIVDFSEAGKEKGGKAAANYNAPKGYEVDPARLELHNKALSYAEQHKCDYVTAVIAVENA